MKIWGVLFFSINALAWDSHWALTEAALASQILPNQTVIYHSLEEALKGKTKDSLLRELKIHKSYAFPNKLHEARGMKIPLMKVLSTYSDEPDWGADQNLFESDQYPELWTKDSPYMTQRDGLKSQAFRHMHFPGKFDWLSPLASLQIPLRPLGEALDRALLYHQLAKDLLNSGEHYWGFRFLAWSLHYIQDMYQPFHVSQTPLKRFIVLKWNSFLPGLDISATGEKIGYYHLSYEKWVEEKLLSGNEELKQALAIIPPLPFEMSRETISTKVVEYANSLAPEVALLSYQIFPRFDPKAGVRAENAVGTKKWESETKADLQAPKLIALTREVFSRLGYVTRQIIQEPLSFLEKRG